MTEIFYTHPKTKLIDIHAVRERIPYSRATIYRLRKTGKFPEPIRLGPNRVAWLESSIDQWIEDRIDAARTVQNSGNLISFPERKRGIDGNASVAMLVDGSNTMAANTA